MKRVLIVGLFLSTVAVSQVCPSSIPAFTGSISQVFGGSTSPYDWVISPTAISTATPAGDTACTAGGYVQQFSPGGGCAASLAVVNTAPAPTANGCTYSFKDSGARQMNIALTCGQSATLSMATTVPVQQTNGVYVYSFTGSINSVCGSGPSPPSPPSPPGPPGPTSPPGPTPPPGPPSEPEKAPACSGGCAFVIIFFVGGFLYVVGAVAWNYFKEGKRGMELAPHPQFWTMVPGLLKDGVFFTGRMITKPCRKDNDGSYTQV